MACRKYCSVAAGIGHQDFAIPELKFVSESAEPGQAKFSNDSEVLEEKFDRHAHTGQSKNLTVIQQRWGMNLTVIQRNWSKNSMVM